MLLWIAEVKKRGERRIDRYKKKLKIPESEISQCPEYIIKSKIRKIFVNKKIIAEYCVKIYEINSYFDEHYEEEMRVDKKECSYILFRINVCFMKDNLAVEVDEKGHVDRGLIFEKKRQEALEEKLDCKFIRINTSKENYDAGYEISKIQTFQYRAWKMKN